MSDNFTLGMDCKLYFKTALLTGPPDGTGWTEIDNPKRLVKRPVAVHVERVYDAGDFADLEPPEAPE